MNHDINMEELINRTKNYGITKNNDGTTSHSPKLSFEGSIRNAIDSGGIDTWGVDHLIKFYKDAKEAWLNGDLEIVADYFGVLV